MITLAEMGSCDVERLEEGVHQRAHEVLQDICLVEHHDRLPHHLQLDDGVLTPVTACPYC